METDYSVIAERYDHNPIRQKTVDTEIGRLLESKSHVKVLDIACGTGSYLKVQSKYYRGKDIEWYGVDKSPEMLEYAKKKVPAAVFIHDSAESAGIPETSFDYIRNEFAFHHFQEKDAVVKNIYRMLRPGGLFIMLNICPDYMNDYWVHRYFPSTQAIDYMRFLPVKDLYALFTGSGFTVDISVRTSVAPTDYTAILHEAVNRDLSHLHLISEEEYQAGLAELKHDADQNMSVISDISFITLKAIKG